MRSVPVSFPIARDSRAAAVFVTAGIALTGIYFALPRGGVAASVVYEGLGASASLALLWGVRHFKPRHVLPWLLLSAGNALFVAGDTLSDIIVNPPVPSAADGFYLAGYPLLAAGLGLLVYHAGGKNRLAAFADAGIVTLAFALLQWVLVMAPAIRSGGSLSEQIVAGLYPAMDVVLLAGFVGFFVSPAWRTPSFGLLAASVIVFFVGDEIYGLSVSAYQTGDWLDATWLLSYVLFGAVALHPSMRSLSEPRQVPALRVSVWRIASLAAALVTTPTILFVQHERGAPLDLPVVLPLATAMALLVVARFSGILRALERIRLRERLARAEAEEMHRQLAVQNVQLLEADRLKDEFVALISHDVRTPLTSIMGYVELALDEGVEPPLDEERRSYLDIVSRSSERLMRIVDDLLFVARLQAGRLVLEPTTLDLAEIVLQAVEEARPRAERKGLTLSVVGDGPVSVEADRGRMFQLLDNLISNAIKFTPEGGRVDVLTSQTADGAVLEVSDTGIGLPPDELELVFERFFRSGHAVSNQIPGTGLGLFIAKAIAEAHGGHIAASRRDGGGTTFRIEMPLHAPATEQVPGEGELVA
jgi:signal transduction histidine kinase